MMWMTTRIHRQMMPMNHRFRNGATIVLRWMPVGKAASRTEGENCRFTAGCQRPKITGSFEKATC